MIQQLKVHRKKLRQKIDFLDTCLESWSDDEAYARGEKEKFLKGGTTD
ncbi:hypothetical protein [Paludifilum halophilum]|nr:hypothetical protein [Paludifilum halophilum]